YFLDGKTADTKLRRMAYEILENNTGTEHIVLAGIRESGSVIARRIQRLLSEISEMKTDLITVTLDKKFPDKVQLSKEDNFDDKTIILIDDVANSGKTMLYALKPFLEFHPAQIQTLVLVERSHKLFPVKPDYVGLSIATTIQEHIFVEVDGESITGAYLG
ncbi:MAG: phosphoribosyltransferase, partial [Gemmatimonadaceae bacterium]|nr:phosphoribosyltransferase [Chitinophagaceae bacterium]